MQYCGRCALTILMAEWRPTERRSASHRSCRTADRRIDRHAYLRLPRHRRTIDLLRSCRSSYPFSNGFDQTSERLIRNVKQVEDHRIDGINVEPQGNVGRSCCTSVFRGSYRLRGIPQGASREDGARDTVIPQTVAHVGRMFGFMVYVVPSVIVFRVVLFATVWISGHHLTHLVYKS